MFSRWIGAISRHNLVSPEAIVQTLRQWHSHQARVYQASLPVAGISGTLEIAFHWHLPRDYKAKAALWAAWSRWLDMLTPWLSTAGFQHIVNQSDQSAETIGQAIDEIVLLLIRCILGKVKAGFLQLHSGDLTTRVRGGTSGGRSSWRVCQIVSNLAALMSLPP